MKVYKYKGKLYSEAYHTDDTKDYAGDLNDLLWAIERDTPKVYCENTITVRNIGYDYYGTSDDTSEEETLDEIIDQGYGDDIELEKVEDEE